MSGIKSSLYSVYPFLVMQDYRHIIESLPEDDKPDFFGLPANIARSSQRIISSQVKLAFFVDLWIFSAAVIR